MNELPEMITNLPDNHFTNERHPFEVVVDRVITEWYDVITTDSVGLAQERARDSPCTTTQGT